MTNQQKQTAANIAKMAILADDRGDTTKRDQLLGQFSNLPGIARFSESGCLQYRSPRGRWTRWGIWTTAQAWADYGQVWASVDDVSPVKSFN
jgi:hypothetical protein